MKGFDTKFSDFPAYILGVTHEIWEGRNIAALHKYYAPDIVVRAPGSVVRGNKDVIAATMATLAEFPDRQLLGEDVIWCEARQGGMLSSHRILSTATHAGDGVYGKATGKVLKYRILADCHAIDNMIDDEWLIRDQGAIVRQLGMSPRRYAAQSIKAEAANPVPPLTPRTDSKGPYNENGNTNEWGQKYADILQRIMAADLTTIPKEYDRAVHCACPGGQDAHGHSGADGFWLGLRASFPSATFTIHHQIGRADARMPPRAALRWSLWGKHDGWGAFGRPSGAEVYVLGLSHAEFGPWGLRREFTLFDETAIWKQILLHSGDHSAPQKASF